MLKPLKTNKRLNNVIDDQQNIENAMKLNIKSVMQLKISLVQTYQDPTLVKSNTTNTYTYDAKLDHLNQSASSQNNSTRSNTNDTLKTMIQFQIINLIIQNIIIMK